MPRLVFCYERDEISRVLQYGCVVEMWDHVVGRTASGSKRRKYHAEFTVAERKTISRYHTQYREWMFGRGLPDHIYFRSPMTVHLLKRAARFFATC